MSSQITRRLGLPVSVCLLALTASSVWANGAPDLPNESFDYFRYAVTDLPQHFRVNPPGPPGSVVATDNTPGNNQITNAGATLGRVLFYDKRLSHNNSTACASCHQQETGFSDPDRLSIGFDGGETGRHSMALTNTKFYENGNMFWDERAGSLEQQVLQPIQDEVEMGMNLDDLRVKLSNTSFYADLFEDAFGTPQITNQRISRSLSQFVRSMVSYDSKFDSAFNANGQPNFNAVLNASERRGHALFTGRGRCAQCHQTEAQVADRPHNTGLDPTITDAGAGNGRFKVPSLRNVAERVRFMHDGRFDSLEEVIEFYSNGINQNGGLAPQLRGQNGQPIRFNFNPNEIQDLISFLETLSDDGFYSNPMFADPFGADCDVNSDGMCNVDDLDDMLAEGPVANGVPVDASGNEIFDLNGDGTINMDDVNQWLAVAADENGLASPYIFGDANLDGAVDVSDFNLWNANKFTTATNWSSGNFNGDENVDVSDFNLWNSNKFTSSMDSAQAVPEPSGLCLLLLAGISVVMRFQRRV